MKKRIKIILLVLMFITLIGKGEVNAALQANGNASKADTLKNWIKGIREMETTGGTLGLTDTINETNLTSNSETSNNLDIHMEKNTEYGAMAILSASAYGNQNTITKVTTQSKTNDVNTTTTGNKTGVYIICNYEFIAAGIDTGTLEYLTNAHKKYVNFYNLSNPVWLPGDALWETNRMA